MWKAPDLIVNVKVKINSIARADIPSAILTKDAVPPQSRESAFSEH